jgi:hypothetical protein
MTTIHARQIQLTKNAHKYPKLKGARVVPVLQVERPPCCYSLSESKAWCCGVLDRYNIYEGIYHLRPSGSKP